MKILEEALLLNDLTETLNLVEEHQELLIKRVDKNPVVVFSLERYNELKAEIYRLKNKDETSITNS